MTCPVLAQLRVVVIVETLDGGFLDDPIHAFDLPIHPRMLDLGQAVLNAMLCTHPGEDVLQAIPVTTAVGELDAVVDLRGSVDGHEQVELALGSMNLGDVDVDVANGTTLEGFLTGLSSRSLPLN